MAEMASSTDASSFSRFKLRRAAQVASAGGVIAYPTEAVFGLGCDPDNLKGVLRLLYLKQRRISAGLILIACDYEQLDPWIDPLPEERQRLESETDTAVTWVVKAHPLTPTWVTGGRPTIAVRITRHPGAAALCRYTQTPLISTSANRRGKPPAKSAMTVRRCFGSDVDYVLAGPLGGAAKPSEIRLARTGQILRPA
jgi:L-threonylcarbamoyladenylate synthase